MNIEEQIDQLIKAAIAYWKEGSDVRFHFACALLGHIVGVTPTDIKEMIIQTELITA